MFSGSTFNVSNRFGLDVASAYYGNLSQGWGGLQRLLEYNYTGGTIFENPVPNTYTINQLIYQTGGVYNTNLNGGYFAGAVLASDGNIYFAPHKASVGFRLDRYSYVGRTYVLPLTNAQGAYFGGVFNPISGYIYFVPYNTNVVTRVTPGLNPIVSTFLMPSFYFNGYIGAVLDGNNEIHFIPYGAPVGAKIATANSVLTYTLPNYYNTFNYRGGVLDSENNICFIPSSIDNNGNASLIKLRDGVFSNIQLNGLPNGANMYFGGVLDIYGNIHFVPDNASVGYKVSVNGVGTTYSLPANPTNANLVSNNFAGGVLGPDGYIHFIPKSARWGMKVSPDGLVTTYPLSLKNLANNFIGGCLDADGIIHFAQHDGDCGVFIDTTSVEGFQMGTAISPYLKGL